MPLPVCLYMILGNNHFIHFILEISCRKNLFTDRNIVKEERSMTFLTNNKIY